MIDIPGTLAEMIMELPDVDLNIPAPGAILVSSKSNTEGSMMMFGIQGSTLTVPTWVLNRNAFRQYYDLANPKDLDEFMNNLKIALSK